MSEESDDDGVAFVTPMVGAEEVDRVGDALASNWLTTGPKTEAFEQALSKYVGVTHAVGTINCTAAIYCALRALDVDGEVITTPITFASTVSSCYQAGATPVLADVRADTLTLDPDSVTEAITPETDAIIPVHYAGQGVDLDALREIATDHDLTIIEDAAHALGGSYDGQPLGTVGDAGCYSFYATKTITTGEGGMLVTDDEDVADRARRLRLAGVDKNSWARETKEGAGWTYDVSEISLKYNMNDVQASIGLAQLEKIDAILSTRRRLADRYDDLLETVPGVEPLTVRDPDEHARHLYPVFVDESVFDRTRNELIDALEERHVGTGVHYIPIHYHSAFEDIERRPLDVAENAYDRLLSLPLHPNMSEEDVDTVVETLAELAR